MVEIWIGDDWAEYHLFLIVVSLKSHSHVSGYQRVPVCWGFLWVLEGCSSLHLFPPVTWPVRYFTMTCNVEFPFVVS